MSIHLEKKLKETFLKQWVSLVTELEISKEQAVAQKSKCKDWIKKEESKATGEA